MMGRRIVVVLLAMLAAVLGASRTASALEPADPDLIPEARRLLDYMMSAQGGKIISGVSRKGPLPAVLHTTGRDPAIWGTDFYGWSRKYDDRYHAVVSGVVDACLYWWQQKGGIVQIHFHWGKPTDPNGSAWKGRPAGAEPLDLARTLTPGTEEYKAFHDDLSVTADYLQQLADARVPVVWRPFHEIDGGWFWWTDPETPQNTAALWRQMFRYLVKERGLHNLIWVYNAAHRSNSWEGQLRREAGGWDVPLPSPPTREQLEAEIAYRKRFYPGDEYVDIASIDCYGNRRVGWGTPWEDARRKAYELMQGVAPGKPLAIGEEPGILNPDIAQRGGPPWLYTMAWWAGDSDWMRHAYNHEHMITLDELPPLHEGNVMPNVRIVWPTDGAALDSREIELAGFASDRNGKLEGVTLYALNEPWLNIAARGGNDCRIINPSVEEMFAAGELLGEARMGAQGRWTFTWQDVPAGYGHVAAIARDADGAVMCSNVVRVTARIENLALGKPASASSQSRSGGPPQDAVDGDPYTSWWSDKDAPDPQWLMVDLGAEKTVGAVSVTWWKAYAKDYAVQVSSDGKSWRDVSRVEGRRKPAGDSDLMRLAPVRARHVRLHCTEPAVDWQHYCVYEFAVYEEVPE